MPRPPRFPFFPHLAVIATLALCGWPASDSAAGPYLNSAHGNATTGVDRTSLPGTYSTGNCAHCHEQHASIGGSPLAPVNGPSSFLLLDDLAGNAACNYCHNGSTPADNIASQIAKAYSHDPNYGTGAALCNDCHDSHVAQKVNHSEATDGNTIPSTSPLLGLSGVTASAWSPGFPGAGAEALGGGTLTATTPPATITREYELCFKCHGGQLGGGAAARFNVYLQFNPTHYAVHPVATEGNPTWKNGFLWTNFATVMNGPWSANRDAEMYCSDCHGSDAAPPEGPHGSTIQYMLKAGGPPAPAGNFDALCLRCHKDPALPGMSSWTDIWGTALVGDHNYLGHQSVVTNPAGTNALGCLACHGDSGNLALASNVHGANYLGNNNGAGTTSRPSYAFLVSSLITQNYFNTAGGDNPGQRNCATVVGCHTGGAARIY